MGEFNFYFSVHKFVSVYKILNREHGCSHNF